MLEAIAEHKVEKNENINNVREKKRKIIKGVKLSRPIKIHGKAPKRDAAFHKIYAALEQRVTRPGSCLAFPRRSMHFLFIVH
jgi:hypothetical protein